MNAKILLSALAITCSACVVVTNAPPEPAAAGSKPAAAKGGPVDQPKASGKPGSLHPGAPMAYWIWRDGNGWHLRTTTAKNNHRFNGRFKGQGAEVQNARMTRAEAKDKFKVEGGLVTFDFMTTGHEDGMDFEMPANSPNACVDFELLIDGKYQPANVVVGAGEQRPKDGHFVSCP
jgi:hypothetical protein